MILFSLIFPKRCKKLFKYPYIYTIKTVQPHIPFFMTDRPTFLTGILRTGLYCLTAMLSAVILSCSSPDKPEYLIGVSQCSDDSWRRQMNEEIRIEALFYPGTEVEVLSADDDNEKQIRDILYFIDKKVDILIVAPNASGAVTPAVETAYDRGIPVILVASSEMCISGFTRLVHCSSVPFGLIFNTETSTILSLAIFVPVVSKSKNTIGLFNCNFTVVRFTGSQSHHHGH